MGAGFGDFCAGEGFGEDGAGMLRAGCGLDLAASWPVVLRLGLASSSSSGVASIETAFCFLWLDRCPKKFPQTPNNTQFVS